MIRIICLFSTFTHAVETRLLELDGNCTRKVGVASGGFMPSRTPVSLPYSADERMFIKVHMATRWTVRHGLMLLYS